MDALAAFASNIIVFLDTIVVQLIFTLAFLAFIWGVYRYFIAGAADEEKRKEGRMFIMYGIIGFFVMFSLWGLVNLLVGAAGFTNNSRPDIPSFSGPGGYAASGCPEGYTYDPLYGECVLPIASGGCPTGSVYNASTDTCVDSAGNDVASVTAPGSVPVGGTCRQRSECAAEGSECAGRIAGVRAGQCTILKGYGEPNSTVGTRCTFMGNQCTGPGERCSNNIPGVSAGICARVEGSNAACLDGNSCSPSQGAAACGGTGTCVPNGQGGGICQC